MIAITEAEVQEMRGGLTQTYIGLKMLTKDIICLARLAAARHGRGGCSGL